MDTEMLEQRVAELEQTVQKLKKGNGELWFGALFGWVLFQLFDTRMAMILVGGLILASNLTRLIEYCEKRLVRYRESKKTS